MSTATQTTDAPQLDHFLVAGGKGYWGKGKTVREAVKAAVWLKPSDRVHVWKVDAKAYVNEMGSLITFAEPKECFEGTVSNIDK